MRTEEDIEDMRSFIAFFDDRVFMNKDYRQGILDAFEFVLNDACFTRLRTIRNKFKGEDLRKI